MPDFTSAGNLNVIIKGKNTSALNSIDKVINRLNNLSNAINSINIGNLQTVTTNIAQMGTAFKGIDLSGLKSLSSLSSRLKRFGENVKSIDWASIQTGFNNLTVAITPFIDKVMTAENALKSLNETMRLVNGRKLKGLSNWSGNVGTGAGGKNKSGGGFFGALGKITTVYFIARRLGTAVAKIAQAGADYTETLNLWETAMSGNLDLATKFVDKMNEAYGISKKTLMNAQATFKNMLGSLGQISESTAYALSEGITQMAVDYASLYNVTFEKAFEKFQSALAGQVRPIRSVSGYDITENTIYELYKQLGGTKSVRNLSRTEKQLLGILAIFNQMTASGAVGDLDKTMESYANQSRVLAEAWKELTAYVGITVTYLIQESGLLRGITAQVIALGQIFKAFAEQSGAIQSFGGDIFGDTEQSAENASNAIDELNGKLLDFDNFRALNEAQENPVETDEKLLAGFERYKSILESATNSARELAEVWLKNSGFMNAEGVFDVNAVKDFVDKIDDFFQTVTAFIATGVIKKLIGWIVELVVNFKNLSASINVLSNVSLFLAVRYFIEAIEKFKEGDVVMGILAVTIGVVLVGAFIALKIAQYNAKKAQDEYTKSNLIAYASLQAQATILKIVASSALALVASYTLASGIINQFQGEGRKVASVCFIIVGAIMAIVSAVIALKTTISWGTMLPVLLAGVGMAIAGVQGLTNNLQSGIQMYANGGLPDKGTMFIAGEAGAEMVYSTPSGQSGVANIQQIAQANYNGTIKALNDWWGGMGAKQDIPKLQGANATGLYQAVTGVAKAQGEHWSKY